MLGGPSGVRPPEPAVSPGGSTTGPARPWIEPLALILITALAAFLRFWQLDTIPPGFHYDWDQARASYAKAVYYRRVGKSGGLILRGELGATLARSREGIPSDFLFRTGGDQSVRGYAYESLGVKRGDAVVGGRYLGVASVEYVQWLAPAWGAAVFYDAGNATDDVRDFKPVHGYGVGARWKSPVGLLKVDLAYGERVRKAQLHFSVGISY